MAALQRSQAVGNGPWSAPLDQHIGCKEKHVQLRETSQSPAPVTMRVPCSNFQTFSVVQISEIQHNPIQFNMPRKQIKPSGCAKVCKSGILVEDGGGTLFPSKRNRLYCLRFRMFEASGEHGEQSLAKFANEDQNRSRLDWHRTQHRASLFAHGLVPGSCKQTYVPNLKLQHEGRLHNKGVFSDVTSTWRNSGWL